MPDVCFLPGSDSLLDSALELSLLKFLRSLFLRLSLDDSSLFRYFFFPLESLFLRRFLDLLLDSEGDTSLLLLFRFILSLEGSRPPLRVLPPFLGLLELLSEDWDRDTFLREILRGGVLDGEFLELKYFITFSFLFIRLFLRGERCSEFSFSGSCPPFKVLINSSQVLNGA